MEAALVRPCSVSNLVRGPWPLTVPPLTAQAAKINESHRKSVSAGKSMLTYAIEAGRALVEVKASLPHGEFQAWCRDNLEFGPRTVQRYMAVAKSDRHDAFDVGYSAFLNAAATPRPTARPTLSPDDAVRILKLNASAHGGNEHEEAIAAEMLD